MAEAPFPKWVDRSSNLREVSPGLYVGNERAPYVRSWDLVVDLCGRGSSSNRTIRWAVPDGEPLPPELLDLVSREVGSTLNRGGSVLIHCAAGLSRSASVAYGLLVASGMPKKEAARRVVTPEGVAAGYPMRKTWSSADQWASGKSRFGLEPSVVLSYPLLGVERHVTSPYGERVSPISGKKSFHDALDLRAPDGTDVVAAADGKVVSISSGGSCGNGVTIEHSPLLRTLVCHLSVVDVSKGQTVRRGEHIGLSGHTGSVTAPHLHFSVQTRTSPDGKWSSTNPTGWIEEEASLAPRPQPSSEVEEPSFFESWWSWFVGPRAGHSEPPPPGTPMSTIQSSAGISVELKGSSGKYGPGDVPSGSYELWINGVFRGMVELQPRMTYRASSIGRLFPIVESFGADRGPAASDSRPAIVGMGYVMAIGVALIYPPAAPLVLLLPP